MLKRAILFSLLLILLAVPVRAAEGSFLLPEDLERLMPADPALIVVVSSFNDLDRHWQEIAEMLAEDSGGGGSDDLLGFLDEFMPDASAHVDLDQPMAVAMGLPDFMGGEEPAVTFIVPVSQAFDEKVREKMEPGEGTLVRRGDFLALSRDPQFAPAETLPALARDLAPGFISARLDLEMVIEAYRPLAEMGIGAMANAAAIPDTSGEGTSAAGMNSEEVDALRSMVNDIMDSARRFEMALSVDGEELTMFTGFAVHPGSPLDAGPQPSFEDALRLTRLLPGGGDIVQAMALDQTRQFEALKPYYLASLQKGLDEMPPEQAEAYRAWLESYLSSLDLFARPIAASIAVSGETMSANMVMESPDPAADLERFAGLFAGLSDADIGMKVKRMPTGKVSGVEVHSWSVDYDAEKLMGLSTNPMSPQMGGTGRMQAEQMIGFLRKVTPSVNMAVRGDLLILSADSDPSRLAHMIQAAGQSRGAAIPDVAAAAAKAGPACQQVVTGDLMAIVAWVTEWMEEIEDTEYDIVRDNPIPFTSAYTIDDGAYGVDWTMDMPAVKRFILAIQELEAMDDASKAPEEPEGE
jgi:hypothetical protein